MHALNVGASSATLSGNTTTLKLVLAFQAAFTGIKNIYSLATLPVRTELRLANRGGNMDAELIKSLLGWQQERSVQNTADGGTRGIAQLAIPAYQPCMTSHVGDENSHRLNLIACCHSRSPEIFRISLLTSPSPISPLPT